MYTFLAYTKKDLDFSTIFAIGSGIYLSLILAYRYLLKGDKSMKYIYVFMIIDLIVAQKIYEKREIISVLDEDSGDDEKDDENFDTFRKIKDMNEIV